MTPKHRWKTTGEVADQLGVSESTIRRWLREEKLEGERIGRRWLIPEQPDIELTVAEAATLVRAHPDTVRRWLAEGKLPGRRTAREWRIPKADLINLIEHPSVTGYPMSDN